MDKTLVELTRAREIGRLPVSGSAYSTKRAAIKTGFGLCLIGGAGALVYWAFNSGISNDTLGTFIFLGIFALCFGLVLPQGRAAYVDVQRREVVKEWWYAFFCSRTVTPIAHYSRIVVRHVCHPGGEAEDTFTGSVGLKPLGGGAVVWVKEFPANKDEMTAEPDQFAQELAKLIGLPYAESQLSVSRAEEPLHHD